MLREYLNVMGQREAKERLEHISAQLQHTCTKEQVTPPYPTFLIISSLLQCYTVALCMEFLFFKLFFPNFFLFLYLKVVKAVSDKIILGFN